MIASTTYLHEITTSPPFRGSFFENSFWESWLKGVEGSFEGGITASWIWVGWCKLRYIAAVDGSEIRQTSQLRLVVYIPDGDGRSSSITMKTNKVMKAFGSSFFPQEVIKESKDFLVGGWKQLSGMNISKHLCFTTSFSTSNPPRFSAPTCAPIEKNTWEKQRIPYAPWDDCI